MDKNIDGNFFKMTVKGVCLGVIFTLLCVLIFALVIKLASLPVSVIKPVNQFIKVMGVFVGCFFSLKGKKGFLKGAICGLLIFLITYLVFALISGTQIFNGKFFIDLIFAVVSGVISGSVAVNIKKPA